MYRTGQKVKALGNALRRIEIPFCDVVREQKISIPCVILFRQKGGPSSDVLRTKGLIPFGKSMGLYILPPLKTRQGRIKDGASLADWMFAQFELDKLPKMVIRFAFFADLLDVFTYTSGKNDVETVVGILNSHIVEYLGADKSLHLTKEYYRKIQKTITEAEIINKTPISHMFSDLIDDAAFTTLQSAEDEMLNDLVSVRAIKNKSYASLALVNKDLLLDCFKRHIGNVPNLPQIVGSAIEQAKFIANQL